MMQEAQRAALARRCRLHWIFRVSRICSNSRIRIFRGDLTDARFRPRPTTITAQLVRSTDSVIHCAASLNRKSEKSCLNVNLRGTLEVIQLAHARARPITACAASAM